MAGDAIELATDALLAELVDFFPEAKRRVFRKMAEKQKRVSTKVADTAHKQLQNPELDKAIDRKIEEIMNSSGNWQELLE
jgi:cytidylate kinase